MAVKLAPWNLLLTAATTLYNSLVTLSTLVLSITRVLIDYCLSEDFNKDQRMKLFIFVRKKLAIIEGRPLDVLILSTE